MDLSSMLNNDDSNPAGPSVPVAKDRPPRTQVPIPTDIASQNPQTRDNATDDAPLPRKRQRVEEPPSPSAVALPTSSKPARAPAPQDNRYAYAESPEGIAQHASRPQPQRSPTSVSRNNSIIIAGDFPDVMEPSIINKGPSEELTRLISDFIYINLDEEGIETLEIEAKLGRIIDVNTNERVRLPVQTEAVVISDTSEFGFHTRFESNMSEKQHKNFNQYLNKAFTDSRTLINGTGAPKAKRIPIAYKHTKQTDSIYSFPHENPRTAQKVRVTRNQEGEVIATIVKQNLGHLNIYSPRTTFDWRVSINNERKVDLPRGMELKTERRKDRMTYIHQHCQIDLTQVINPAEKEKTHELEVELSDIEALRIQAEHAKAGRPTKYEDMVKVFVDNVRLLARVDKG